MYLEILIVGCLLINDCLGESNIWRTVYVDPLYWTSESTITASSKLNCAMKASQLQWPNLIRYTDDGSCYLSSLKIAPIENNTVILNYLACMTKLLPLGRACNAPFTMVTDGNGCYRFVNSAVTFSAARDQCIAMGADLASPGLEKSNDLYGIVYEQLGIDNGVAVWIGVKRENANSPFLQVSTPGSPTLPSEFWDVNEPGSYELYVAIRSSSRLLIDLNPDVLPFLCEIHGLKF